MAERTVVLRYTAPVWVTVDLDGERVSKVEVGDTEVELERDEHGIAVVVDASEGTALWETGSAAQIAEESIWPAWQ